MTSTPRHRGRSPAASRTARVLLAAVAGALLAGCGGPRAVPLADLAFEMERYHGDTVVTRGVVVEFGPADGALQRHFVIQDAEANRVELLPTESAEPHVGRLVEVTGAFEYDPARGRVLHVETIEAAGSDS